NIGFAVRWLGESHTERSPAVRTRAHSSLRTTLRIVVDPIAPASRLVWNYAIAIGSSQGVNVVLAYFLYSRFGVTEQTIGRFLSGQGAIWVFARSLLLDRMLLRFGEARLSRLGLVTLAVGLGALPFADSLPTLALATGLIPLGTAFTFPCVTGLL